MANTFKFGNGNWAVKDGYALAYNDENNNFKPLPFDFTRASSATRVNKQGLIETVPSGKPRIDFLDNTSGHLLLEPSRTNLAQRSQEFDSTYWGKSNGTVTANQTISPDGSQNAEMFAENTSTASHLISKSGISISSSTSYTLSVFVKANGRNTFRLFKDDGAGSFAFFNVQNGSIGSKQGLTGSKIENYGNGWYRCSINFTSTSTSVYIQFLLAQDNETTSYTGDGSSGMYFYGAQLEAGSYATSYIPTEGSSVTRVAETCVDAGNDKILGTHCTMFINLSTFTNNFGSAEAIRLSDGTTTTDRIQIFTETTDNTVKFIATANGSNALSGMAATTATTDLTSETKIAVQIGSNANRIYVNGTKIGETSTSFSFNSGELKSLNFATSSSGGNNFYGKIRNVRLYNTALTDTELQNLTS